MKYPTLNMYNNKQNILNIISPIGNNYYLGKWKKSIDRLYWYSVSTPNNDGIMIVALV